MLVVYIQQSVWVPLCQEVRNSKRFVRRRAPVNNLTSRGGKGHGSRIHWKTRSELRAGCFLLLLSERCQGWELFHRTHRLCVFCIPTVPAESLDFWIDWTCWHVCQGERLHVFTFEFVSSSTAMCHRSVTTREALRKRNDALWRKTSPLCD